MIGYIKDSLSFIYIAKAVSFLLKNKQLLKYALFNFLVSFILMTVSFYFIFSDGMSWYEHIAGGLNTPEAAWYLSALFYTLLPFFFLLTISVSLFVILILSQLLNAPFNTVLSEKVEMLMTGKEFHDPLSLLAQIRRDILYETRKFIFFMILLIIPLPLLIIPAAGGIIYTVVSTLILMYTLTFDFLDYPMERDMLSLKDRRKLLLSRPGIWFGYGGIMFLVFAVPLLNILVWPVLITSGTMLYIDRIKPEISKKHIEQNE